MTQIFEYPYFHTLDGLFLVLENSRTKNTLVTMLESYTTVSLTLNLTKLFPVRSKLFLFVEAT